MKNLLFGFFLIFTSLFAFSQPVVKIFAYEQEIIPGTIPANVTDENGNPLPEKSYIKKEHRLFFSCSKNYNPRPVLMFIRQQPFAIQAAAAVSTPVIHSDHVTGNKKTLVEKTGNKVLELVKGDAQQKKNYTANLTKLIKANDVVIVYEWKGKKYYAVAKKLKKLEPQQNL
ncbi:MAG: hypothetical protein C4308_01680 [Chitinophagaceae bacterium]